MNADPVRSTSSGCCDVVPKVAWPPDAANEGPVDGSGRSEKARYAANPSGLIVGSAQAPVLLQAGWTNIGIRRKTPSESSTTSVDARITFLIGFWHGTLGLEFASAHQNFLSGSWSTPAGSGLADVCSHPPPRGIVVLPPSGRITGIVLSLTAPAESSSGTRAR